MIIKKIISIVLALALAFCLACVITSCSKKDDNGIIEVISEIDEDAQPIFANPKTSGATNYVKYEDKFNRFNKYYKKDFKEVCGEKFYLLNPGFKQYTDEFQRKDNREYNVYADTTSDGALLNPVIYENLGLFDKNIESADYSQQFIGDYLDGSSNITVNLKIVLMPVSERLEGTLKLQFGYKTEQAYDLIYHYDYFINLIIEETCIATCYVHPYIPIQLNWFENYFKTNLIYGG